MTQAVVWKNGDKVSITVPSPEYLASGKSIDNLPGVPSGVEKIVCDARSVPTDRTFRNAWRFDANKVHGCGCNMAVAKEIAADRVREARKPAFEKLDVLTLQKLEGIPEPVHPRGTLAERKQWLRDAPNDSRIANATNEASLKAALETVIAEIESEA